jgi:hypothetical protein
MTMSRQQYGWKTVTLRLGSVLRGDGATLRRLSKDRGATGQAFAITAAASAVGQFTIDREVGALALGAVSGSIGLVAWSLLLWSNGRMLGGMARWAEILRGVGFAAAPFVLIGIPVVGVAAVVYSVALQVAALKHIHGITTGRSMAAVVTPWLLLVVAVALGVPGR